MIADTEYTHASAKEKTSKTEKEKVANKAKAASAKKAEGDALGEMAHYYEEAEQLGLGLRLPDVYYPALNRLGAMLLRAEGQKLTLDGDYLTTVSRAVEAHADTAPDFWNVVAQVDLRVYSALANVALVDALPGVLAGYDDLQRRINQTWQWASVCDQMEFVLRKYKLKADKAERDAANALAEYLATLASVRRPTPPPRRRRRSRQAK